VREQDSGDRVSEQANASRSETFIALWSNFPGHEVMDRERAAEVFAALAEPDRQWARFAAIDYGKRLEALKRRPVDAHKWLERRGFEEFPDAKKLIPKPKRFAAEDSAAWKAWWVYCAMVGVPTPVVQFLPEGRGGTFPAEVPPCGLGYAAYADVPTATWPIAEPETPHWFAWSKRVHDWCGRWPEPELIMLDGTVTHTDGSGKTFETQRRTKGRRYPREWPLNKAEAQLSGQTDGDGA
jgi:hypothetical protein